MRRDASNASKMPNANAVSVSTHFEKKRTSKQTDTETDSHARQLIVLTVGTSAIAIILL